MGMGCLCTPIILCRPLYVLQLLRLDALQTVWCIKISFSQVYSSNIFNGVSTWELAILPLLLSTSEGKFESILFKIQSLHLHIVWNAVCKPLRV